MEMNRTATATTESALPTTATLPPQEVGGDGEGEGDYQSIFRSQDQTSPPSQNKKFSENLPPSPTPSGKFQQVIGMLWGHNRTVMTE